MRVLQINSVCGVGSTGRIATDIHAILKENGHDSYIAYGRENPLNCDTAIKIGDNLDNYVHVAKTRIFDNHGFGSKKATKEFISKLEEVNPDIIHLHNIHGYYINIELLFNYLKNADKPVVWTMHDCWPFTGHCSYFDYVQCDRWKTGCYDCPQKKSYPSSFLLDHSKENYVKKSEIFLGVNNLTIVTPSEWLADLVKQSYLKEYEVKVINNGIDLNTFNPSPSKFKEKYNIEDKFIILGVASPWNQRKGFKYFMDLSNQLIPDEVIVMVGLSENQKKDLPENIIGISRTNSVKELAEIYSAADVFLNPTLEDNFPTTNLEALACGTPIITFNTGGSIEAVKEDKTGFIVEKGDLENLLVKLRTIKETGKQAYTKNCLDDAERLYNKNFKYQEYIELYDQVKNKKALILT